MGEQYRQFAAALFKNDNFGHKIDRNGKSWWDRHYEKGNLAAAPSAKEVCHCFLNFQEFIAIGFNKQISEGIGIVPGVAIPIGKRMELGKPYVEFKLSEVKGYKRMQTLKDGTRFVVNITNGYVQIQPVAKNTFKQGSRNKELIVKIHREYEKLGVKSRDGPGYTSNYDEPFLRYMEYLFSYYTKKGYIQRKSDLQHMVCPKHKTIGKFISENNTYYCEKCKDNIC